MQAVLFDLDDTLFDYEYSHKQAMAVVFSTLEKEFWISKELWELLFSIAQKDVKRQLIWVSASHNKELYFQRFFELLNREANYKILPKNIIKIFKLYRKIFYSSLKQEKASLALLKFLKAQGIKTGIITDSQTYSQLEKMQKLGIAKYIDVLVSSEEAWSEKPHAFPFLLAAHKLWVLASECIMVGDNILRDIEGANNLGMKTIWINRYQKDNHGVIPSYRVDDTEALYALLKTLFPS